VRIWNPQGGEPAATAVGASRHLLGCFLCNCKAVQAVALAYPAVLFSMVHPIGLIMTVLAAATAVGAVTAVVASSAVTATAKLCGRLLWHRQQCC
jgi:hypothetical protein